jgi:hypothetical protein
MTAPDPTEPVERLLRHLTGGSMEVRFQGEPLVSLDAVGRNLDLHVDPLLSRDKPGHSLLHEGHISLWRSLGFPSRLARLGWRVTFHAGTRELISMGREASALTGHVRLHPLGLWKLRKLL